MTSSSLSLALAAIFVGFTATAAFLRWLGGRLPPLRMWPDLSSLEAMLPIFTVLPVMTNAFICHYNGVSIGLRPLPIAVPGGGSLLPALCFRVLLAACRTLYCCRILAWFDLSPLLDTLRACCSRH